ncbi:Guanylate cyclase [Aphelenchoides fujianensis]|nr:Guanylate cyclase [Aphelenchoides fujianensis]
MFLLLLLLFLPLGHAQIPQIKVGLLIPRGTSFDDQVGFETSAGAIPVALRKAIDLKIYDPSLYNISFAWYFDNCVEELSAGYAAKLITHHRVSAIIGPVCPPSARVVGALTTFGNVLSMPTQVALTNVLTPFNWTKIGFVYQSGTNYLPNGTETYTRQVRDVSVVAFQDVLKTLKSRARIIITCIETTQAKRNLLLAAASEKMLSYEFVFLFIQTNAAGFGNPPFWVGTGDQNDAVVKEAAKNVLILDRFLNDTQQSQNVRQQIVEGIREWPFNCLNCSTRANASSLAVYLGDSFFAFMLALNQSYEKNGPAKLKNMTALIQMIQSAPQNVPSLFGGTFLWSRGIRSARYALIGLDTAYNPTVWAVVHSQLNTSYSLFNATYKDAATSIWATRGGQTPLSLPLCGFLGEKCVGSPLLYTAVGVGGAMFFLLVVCALLISIFLFNREQRKKLNALWQIQYILLDKTGNTSANNTARSTISGVSSLNGHKNTDKTEYVYYRGEIVVALKRPQVGGWTAAEKEEFRKMRRLDHPNLNRFIGVASFDRHDYFIWQYCERGSIMDVMDSHADSFDTFIITCMIGDIVEGLHYLHNSSFKQHGGLCSWRCLVGDRFNVRIQCYGLCGHKARTRRILTNKSALFVAPELLQGAQNYVGSPPGDMYALGVICCTILTMNPPYEAQRGDMSNEELVARVARGEYPLFRPTLDVDPVFDIKPKFFALMESNAAVLEQDVQERRAALTEEKKKADLILNRMMPREAADLLKAGHSVPPELFDEATVFFSADNVLEQHDTYKVETIGDGLHVVSGIPKKNGHAHARAIAAMALDFRREIQTLRLAHLPNEIIRMRMGIHTGGAVAGIVGMTAPRYCVFGDTVNLAAKMEASGQAGRIHITNSTKTLLETHYAGQFVIAERGEVLIKSIGSMETFWIVPPEEASTFQP